LSTTESYGNHEEEEDRRVMLRRAFSGKFTIAASPVSGY